jgi:hypothetical protein
MLLIVRKTYWLEFRAGTKSVEYRRYGPRFNERVFRIDRLLAIGYARDRRSPRLLASVASFATRPVAELPEMLDIYPDMKPDGLIAEIGLALHGQVRIT